VIASILIAFASSLKLPLSTTYVSFMVAMGASLADRAWGKGSAPYRVAGVVNVIGGWFVTAAAAFALSAIIALAIFFGGNYMALALFFVALIAMYRSNRRSRN
jgi:phosphate/sulfate permease